MGGDTLAEREVDPGRMVHEDAHALAGDALREEHLDLRLSRGQSRLDLGLDVSLHSRFRP
jgi:hypothetical protein